jgi:hypothetical protein
MRCAVRSWPAVRILCGGVRCGLVRRLNVALSCRGGLGEAHEAVVQREVPLLPAVLAQLVSSGDDISGPMLEASR